MMSKDDGTKWLERSNEFKDAMVNVRLEYKGTSGGVAKVIARTVLQSVMETVPKYIARKAKVLEHREAFIDQHAALMS